MLLLALWPSYSSCDPYSYGATGNAASTALSWGMGSVLPDVPGIYINGLLYRYTTVKNPEDNMKVHVGNKKASGDGYIFRETDDWSGVPGNTIVKSFPLSNIPATQWGAGSIDIEGKGSVKDAVVIYNYRIDECFNEQSNPACPGYVKPMPVIPVVEVYNALEDDAVVDAIDADTDFEYDEDGELILSEEEEEEELSLFPSQPNHPPPLTKLLSTSLTISKTSKTSFTPETSLSSSSLLILYKLRLRSETPSEVIKSVKRRYNPDVFRRLLKEDL